MIELKDIQFRQYQSWLLYGLVFVFFLGDLLKLSPLFHLPLDGIRLVEKPVEQVITQAVYLPVQIIQNAWHSHQIIQDLQRKNVELVALIGEADALRAQNASLREELEKGSETRGQSVAKRRVAGNAFIVDQYLEIDQGRKSGVRVGDVVLYRGVLIGQVDDVSEFFSRAVLLQMGNFSLSAQTSQGTTGLAELHEGILKMRQIPSDQPLSMNDRVFSLGSYEHSIPPNIPIGTVQKIIEYQERPTKEVIVDQGMDLRTVNTVMIEGY